MLGRRAWARPARQFCRARRTPTAKWPRTTFYILLPVLFFTKKAPLRIVVRNGAFGEKRFAPRCFHALLNALSSPRGALTAVFGMGTGVTPPPEARTKKDGNRMEENQKKLQARGAKPAFHLLRPMPPARNRGQRAHGAQTARPIRSGMLNASRHLHIRPVKRVVFPWP